MRKVRNDEPKPKVRKLRPVLNPDIRENRMIDMAMDLAEKKLMDGTASSQLICHYLKLGSSVERLEREKLEKENELLKAKTEAIQSAKRIEGMYAEALDAFRSYGGGQQSVTEEELDDEYDE